MTFYPLKFWGIPPYLGWQGIIPRKAHKMSSKAVDMLTSRLIRVEELFERADPDVMAREMSPPIKETTAQLVEDIGHSSNPQMWAMVPQAVKDGTKDQINAQVPNLVKAVVADIKTNILTVFDVKSHVIDNLTGNNVNKLVELFQRAGKNEFKFIEMCGLYFGFTLGLVQTLVWYFYQSGWTLPVIGIIVGYLTNWLALQMIFRPFRPTRYLFFTYQGLFLKRQKEVSAEYAKFMSSEILSARKVMDNIVYGSMAHKMFDIAQHHIIKAISQIEGLARPFATVLIGNEEYDAIKRYVISKMTAVIPSSARRVEAYIGQTMDLENLLSSRMSELPPEQFEDLLRSAFREDEIILILVGAFLGCAVGFIQWGIFN